MRIEEVEVEGVEGRFQRRAGDPRQLALAAREDAADDGLDALLDGALLPLRAVPEAGDLFEHGERAVPALEGVAERGRVEAAGRARDVDDVHDAVPVERGGDQDGPG